MVLPFAAIAFVLLLVEWLPPRLLRRALATLTTRPHLRVRQPAATLAVALCLLAPMPGPAEPGGPEVSDEADEAPVEVAPDDIAVLEARARLEPLSAGDLLELGVARARADRWEEARNSFLAAAMLAGEGEIAAIAYHDLGVAALRRGELENAREFFFDSLAIRPASLETRFNLEWTIAALAVEAPPDDPAMPREPTPHPQSPDTDEADTEAAPDPGAAGAPKTPKPGAGEVAGDAGTRSQTAKLSDAQRERWIDRIADDPARALASAARRRDDEPREGRRRDVPAW